MPSWNDEPADGDWQHLMDALLVLVFWLILLGTCLTTTIMVLLQVWK